MPPLLHIVLSNALMATALAVLVAIMAYIARRPALTHVLWLLVLFKLLTPGVIPLPVSWPVANEASSSTSDSTEPPPLTESSVPVKDALSTSEPAQEVTVLIYPAAATDSVNMEASSESTEKAFSILSTGFWQTLSARLSNFWPWLALAWLAGSLVWLGLTASHVCRFQRLLRHARLAPAELQDQVNDWSQRLSLRKPPALWLLPGCVSPMLWTLGRSPRLLFPAKLLDRLDADQRSALLVHELAHLRRRDHWVRFLEMAVMAVYWWHPVLWWARRELHEAEEQCCDAWVVWALSLGGEPGCVSARRRAYALALLHTVDFFSHTRPTLPAPASGVGQVPHLRRRLTMIMNGNTSKSLSAAGWLAVLTLGLLLPLIPVQAQQDPKDDHRDPRDQQIENLKKVINALEEQRRAEQVNRAVQAQNQPLLTEELDRIKIEKAKADEQQRAALRALRLQEAQLTQNQDPEPRHAQVHRLNLDEASPGVRKLMQAMEEITKTIEAKRHELQSLEIKLRETQVKLEQMRAENARGEAERRVIRVRPKAEIHGEPIIIKVDPSMNPEEVRMQVERIQGSLKQPIRVEIIKPETGPANIRNRAEPAPEARPRERRDSRSENLEEKLEKIMKEVDELRRELRSSRQ